MPDGLLSEDIRHDLESIAAEGVAKSFPWPRPIPIDRLDLPPFPVDALPKWLGAYAQALADETQTPVDLAGMLALAALATAAQRRYLVEIRPGFKEPLQLWILAMLNSAERKSAVYRRVLAPVYERQREMADNGRAERARAVAELGTAEARLAKAVKDAGTKSGSDATAAVCARDEAVDDVERLKCEIPPEAVLLLDDVTPERFAQVLADVGAVTIASAEGGVFANFFGRYANKVPNLDLLLKSHAGDSASVDRVGRGRLVIEEPACTFALAVQPDVLVEAASKHEWNERGGMARFLYAMPRAKVGSRQGAGAAMPQRIEGIYRRRMLDLLPAKPPTHKADQPPVLDVIRFDHDAQRAWEEFYDGLEPRLDADEGDLGWCNKWGGKFPSALARIAALLQLAEHGPSDVGLQAIGRALMFAPYLEAHAVAALTAANERPALADARKLLGWIRRQAPASFTEREAYRVNFGQDPHRAAEACQVLADRGWIRSEDGGRSDSKRWQPHPEVLEAAAVSARGTERGKLVATSPSPTNRTATPYKPETSPGLTLRTLDSERTPAEPTGGAS